VGAPGYEHPTTEAAVEVAESRIGRAGSSIAALTHGIVLAVTVAGVLAMGVRSEAPIAAMMVLALLVAAILAWQVQARRPVWAWGAFALSQIVVGLASLAFGPFILFPSSLALLSVYGVSFSRSRSWLRWGRFLRPAALLGPLVTFGVVVGLEWAGVLAPSMKFSGGNIVILPRALDFPPAATLISLVALNLIGIALPALLVLRMRDAGFENQRAALEAAARLRALVPAPARETAAL
jgi:hypothetical protein